MAAAVIPTEWRTHLHEGGLYYLRYPYAWAPIRPKSWSATFAAESADRMVLFEVLSLRHDGDEANVAELLETALLKSLQEDFAKFRLKRRREVELPMVVDSRVGELDMTGISRPGVARQMLCRMVDVIPCFQETYTLQRQRLVLHLNFKVAKKLYRRRASTFGLVASSTYLGIPQ